MLFRLYAKRFFVSKPTTRASLRLRQQSKYSAEKSPKSATFQKILIANRGEIAVRVMKTAKRLGIRTVAVYSDADRTALHVEKADEAEYIGPSPASDSYLNIDNIIRACKNSKADAVHPGYGFLSENPVFVSRLAAEGITFIGPETDAIVAMGDKIQSKKIAKEAGVNVIPGFVGEVTDEDHAVEISLEIGFPVMLKPSAGGGGKGMRVARDEEEVRHYFSLAKNEAILSFGDGRLLIERYLEEPRHIEIQLLGDKHGNVSCFPERDCSVQRRNQKVVEESPATVIHPDVRREMIKQARNLAKSVGYISAGTVEFMLDAAQNFYFLEMNTRLQVEHPVTEMITNEDLVEHMINIAAGFRLPSELIRHHMVPFHGHAIECRLYAEDPMKNFIPSVGQLTEYQTTIGEDGIRVDNGVSEGNYISMFYDPIISKLVTYGETREDAVSLMEDALSEYIIRGIRTNIPFCIEVMRNSKFQDGRATTKFIEEEYGEKGFQGTTLEDAELKELASTVFVWDYTMTHNHNDAEDVADDAVDDPKDLSNKMMVTLTGLTGQTKTFPIRVEGLTTPEDHQVNASRVGRIDEFSGAQNEDKLREYAANMKAEEGAADDDQEEPRDLTTAALSNGLRVSLPPVQEEKQSFIYGIVNDNYVPVQLHEYTPKGYHVEYRGARFDVTIHRNEVHELMKHMIQRSTLGMSNLVKAPMAGSLVAMKVKAGDSVTAGQSIAIVEAMKMQNEVIAERDAVVKTVQSNTGDNITEGQLLIEFEK